MLLLYMEKHKNEIWEARLGFLHGDVRVLFFFLNTFCFDCVCRLKVVRMSFLLFAAVQQLKVHLH